MILIHATLVLAAEKFEQARSHFRKARYYMRRK